MDTERDYQVGDLVLHRVIIGRPRATRATEPRYRPPGRRGILDEGLVRGGGPGRSPFWRTPKESCKGLGSVTLKINTQRTQSG
jgi:hypothetical protein